MTEFGADTLYMPHMITADRHGNVWVTDVALQQATKFGPSGERLLSLGVELEPGHDEKHFCKPTQVPAPLPSTRRKNLFRWECMQDSFPLSQDRTAVLLVVGRKVRGEGVLQDIKGGSHCTAYGRSMSLTLLVTSSR